MSEIKYENPIGVAVVIVPVADVSGKMIGVLGCRRNIEPFIGGVALISGYQDKGYTLRETAKKELYEEAGISVESAQHFSFVDERMTGHNRNLVFFEYTGEPIPESMISNLNFDEVEVQELVVIRPGDKLCFDLHEDVLSTWFRQEQ